MIQTKITLKNVFCTFVGICFNFSGLCSQNKLTPEMISKINTTEKQDIYSVAETVKFDGQVLRANELVFAPESVLELTNLNQEYIILVADKIKFTAPLKRATIKRNADAFAESGSDGKTGSNGLSGTTGNKNGSDGTAGNTGEKGGKGETKQLPKIYIITNQVTSQDSNQLPDFINLKLLFTGIDGGNGGRGGSGGDGGNGGNGRKSSSAMIGCKRGGGDGGNGGIAGKGGQGGNGGDGGNGSDIIFIGSDNALDILSYSIIINTGGSSGLLGRTGAMGMPGRGGNPGEGSINCHGGDKGKIGLLPDPKDEGIGQKGKEGEKGKVDKYKISEFPNILF